MTSLNSPYLHVVYCDDVRLEVGNTLPLVGLHAGELNTPQVPVMLPKLCLHCAFVFPKELEITKLVFRVYRDDELLIHQQIDFPQPPPHIADDPTVTLREHIAGFTFAPFPIEGPAVLRVEAMTDVGTFPSQRLRIAVVNEPSSSRREALVH
jgi:hypothetical protein